MERKSTKPSMPADPGVRAASATVGAAAVKEYYEHYRSEAVALLAGGTKESFGGGLQRLLGIEPPPDPIPIESLAEEFTQRNDRVTEFITPNYGMTTNSVVEWLFLVDPEVAAPKHAELAKEAFGALGLKVGEWPVETRIERRKARA